MLVTPKDVTSPKPRFSLSADPESPPRALLRVWHPGAAPLDSGRKHRRRLACAIVGRGQVLKGQELRSAVAEAKGWERCHVAPFRFLLNLSTAHTLVSGPWSPHETIHCSGAPSPPLSLRGPLT